MDINIFVTAIPLCCYHHPIQTQVRSKTNLTVFQIVELHVAIPYTDRYQAYRLRVKK
jgi:hypothetical protein